MSTNVLLDMTRAAARRWNGNQPSGIDRVCDAYANHFAQRAIAVLQVRGRAVILNRAASDMLMQSLDAPQGEFRRSMVAALTMSAAAPLRASETDGAYYINVGHSDFDLDAHWRWVGKRGLRPIYLLHDLIPITNPSVTTPHKAARHRGRVESSIRSAAGIVANSHTTAQALRAFARDNRLRLPPMLVSHIAAGTLPPVRKPLPPSGEFFLSIGTIERRKNPGLLLKVWDNLRVRLDKKTPRLVFAGGLGKGHEEVLQALESNPGLARLVDIKSDLDDRDLAKLLTEAKAVLLPSLAEGYGIPLVEALERKVPVIGSNLESFAELGQGIPTLLAPFDVESWTDAVCDFCDSGPEYQRQTKAMAGFNPPSWSQHFAMLNSWLYQLRTREADTNVLPNPIAAFA